VGPNTCECAADWLGDLCEDYSQSFQVWPAAGWEVVNHASDGAGVWAHCDPAGTCYRTTPRSFGLASGAFMGADSDQFKSPAMHTSLISPPIDLTEAGTAALELVHRVRHFSGQRGDIEVSTNDGTSWAIVRTFTSSTVTAGELLPIDLSAYTGEEIRLRFRYQGSNAWYWLIDQVTVTVGE